MGNEQIAAVLYARWVDCNERVREAVIEGNDHRMRVHHIRRDEVVMLSVKLGVSGILDRMVDDGASRFVIATPAMSY